MLDKFITSLISLTLDNCGYCKSDIKNIDINYDSGEVIITFTDNLNLKEFNLFKEVALICFKYYKKPEVIAKNNLINQVLLKFD